VEKKFSDSRESSSALGTSLGKFVNLSDDLCKFFLSYSTYQIRKKIKFSKVCYHRGTAHDDNEERRELS
jgi:hypothetical protein